MSVEKNDDRNRGFLPNGYVESNDGPLVEIEPDYTDHDVLNAWEGVLSLELPDHPVIERTVLRRYSAQQCRDLGVEPGSWWGEDGELKTWVLVAEVTEGDPS